MLKLYLYGYLQQLRSSRRLEAECHRNIELMRLRRCTVERPFAELKERLFGRRFLQRGLAGAACEMALGVMAFNLKRLMSLLEAATLMRRLQIA